MAKPLCFFKNFRIRHFEKCLIKKVIVIERGSVVVYFFIFEGFKDKEAKNTIGKIIYYPPPPLFV